MTEANSTAAPAAVPSARISEIDILRGLVIALMALDHTRDYFILSAELANNPLDPATPWAYVTRWITHLCAPTFLFLAGVSTYLQAARKTKPQLSMLLLTRGLWLIALEVTLISFGWSFGFPYLIFLQVIWAIGWSMLILAALIWLPRMAVLAIGVAIIAGHNLLDPIRPQDFGDWSLFWTFFHERGPIFAGDQPVGLIGYPILPWAGIMAFGHGLGALFSEAPKQRDGKVFALGLAMLALFALLRWTMAYGEPASTGDWREQTSLGATIMVFLDVQKNAPSLQFTLMTLGLVFTLWPLLARLRGPLGAVLNTFGAVPFFFYVLHVYLVHALAIAANAAAGQPVAGQFNYLMNLFVAPEKFEGAGFALPWVYVAWLVVLALLYPLCRYWQGVKARERKWWMSYL